MLNKNWLSVLLLALLIGTGFLVYLPSFKVPFQFDDYRVIVENPHIRVRHLTPRSLFNASFQNRMDNRPLGNLSFALNYYFHQFDLLGYHLINFLLLIFSAVGIWLGLALLFKNQGFHPFRSWLAGFLSALVWTVHPVNVQSITYIVQRYSALAGAFSIWSLVFLALALERKKFRGLFFLGSILFCLSAILSKESALTLPILLLLYKIYFSDQLKSGWLKANWKWLALLGVSYFFALILLFRPEMFSRFQLEYQSRFFTLRERILTEPKVLIWYLLLILFPIPQALSLQHDFTIVRTALAPGFLMPMALVLSALILALALARKQKFLSFALLWYLLTLLVEALPFPIDLAQEHRLYLSSLSIIIPLVSFLILNPQTAKPGLTWVFILIFFFGFFSFSRNLVWQTQTGLWKDAVLKAPKTSRPWLNYCYYLAEAGQCVSAIRACQITLNFDPKADKALNSLGICYFETGKPELAEQQFLSAIKANPEQSWAYFNLGRLYNLKGDFETALKWYQAGMEKDPENAEAHYLLALIYANLQNEQGFVQEMTKAMDYAPEWKEPRFKLTEYLVQTGQCSQALQLINTASVPDSRLHSLQKLCIPK